MSTESLVGQGATLIIGTDRYAGTIVAETLFMSIREITFQADKVTRIDKNGMSDTQEYSYAPNPNAMKDRWRETTPGKWKPVDERTNRVYNSPMFLLIGERDHFVDFSF